MHAEDNHIHLQLQHIQVLLENLADFVDKLSNKRAKILLENIPV